MDLIQIKNKNREVLFEHDDKDNSIKETLELAVKNRVTLSGADLTDVDLTDTTLSGADLTYTNLSKADLRRANLSRATLSGANLWLANLRGADLRGADLTDANLSGADLRGSTTDKRYISVSCIGSAKRMTTYCFEDDKI